MMDAMSAALAFCRLVLGDQVAATAAADAAVSGVDRVDEVAGAWLACASELERRRGALAWEDAAAAPGQPAVVSALAALGDLERAAVAAQALGLAPGAVEQALGTEAGAAPGLLARAHAAIGAFGRPADAACAEERERLAAAPGARRAPRSKHCAECRAFAGAVGEQRRALRRFVEGDAVALGLAVLPTSASAIVSGTDAPASARSADEAAADGARTGLGTPKGYARARAALGSRAGAVGETARAGARTDDDAPARAGSSRRARAIAMSTHTLRRAGAAAGPRTAVLARGLEEPAGRGPRAAVALAVVLLAGLVGFGAVSLLETPHRGGGDSDVITATPVGPLPPGVGPTQP